jgi:hypothetical protein
LRSQASAFSGCGSVPFGPHHDERVQRLEPAAQIAFRFNGHLMGVPS